MIMSTMKSSGRHVSVWQIIFTFVVLHNLFVRTSPVESLPTPTINITRANESNLNQTNTSLTTSSTGSNKNSDNQVELEHAALSAVKEEVEKPLNSAEEEKIEKPLNSVKSNTNQTPNKTVVSTNNATNSTYESIATVNPDGDLTKNETSEKPQEQDILPEEGAAEKEHSSSLAIFFILFVIIFCIFLVHTILKYNCHHIPESLAIVFLGALVGLIMKMLPTEDIKKVESFSPTMFFLVLLPPIIFESGYNLHKGECSMNINYWTTIRW